MLSLRPADATMRGSEQSAECIEDILVFQWTLKASLVTESVMQQLAMHCCVFPRFSGD